MDQVSLVQCINSHGGHGVVCRDVCRDVFRGVFRGVYKHAYFSMTCGGRDGCDGRDGPGSYGHRNNERDEGLYRHPRRHGPSGNKHNREILIILNCHHDGDGLRRPYHR